MATDGEVQVEVAEVRVTLESVSGEVEMKDELAADLAPGLGHPAPLHSRHVGDVLDAGHPHYGPVLFLLTCSLPAPHLGGCRCR